LPISFVSAKSTRRADRARAVVKTVVVLLNADLGGLGNPRRQARTRSNQSGQAVQQAR
jgi:hypothetical protein